jgi:hypothetical protein
MHQSRCGVMQFIQRDGKQFRLSRFIAMLNTLQNDRQFTGFHENCLLVSSDAK